MYKVVNNRINEMHIDSETGKEVSHDLLLILKVSGPDNDPADNVVDEIWVESSEDIEPYLTSLHQHGWELDHDPQLHHPTLDGDPVHRIDPPTSPTQKTPSPYTTEKRTNEH